MIRPPPLYPRVRTVHLPIAISNRQSSFRNRAMRTLSRTATSSLHTLRCQQCSSQRQAPLNRTSIVFLPHSPTAQTSSTITPVQTRNIRTIPINKSKHIKRSRFNHNPNTAPLSATPAGAYARRIAADSLPLRTGVLAVKKGMTAIYIDAAGEPNSDSKTTATPFEGGRRVPATILQMDRNQVVANKTRKRHGYFAVVVGEGWRRPERVGRAMMGVFAKARLGELPDVSRAKIAKETAGAEDEAEGKEGESESRTDRFMGLPPKRQIREFKIRDERGLLPIGAAITPAHFVVGQFVDARGTARGMGFAGGMKRHGFGGQPASHGVSKTHRSMGSAGGGQGSGSRVHPGKRMAGNMGGQRHTVQSLKVLMVDEANGLVVVNGAVSGRKGDLVMLSDALKKPWPDMPAVA